MPVTDPGGAISDIELMDLHARTLFVHDGGSRLRFVNDIGQPMAPRMYLGRTRVGNLWRVRADLPMHLVREIEALCGDEPVCDDLTAPPRHADRYRSLLTPFARTWSGPAMRIATIAEPTAATVPITAGNAELLDGRFDDWIEQVEQRQPVFAVLFRNRPVAVCASARITTEACEAALETHFDFRGRGFAAEAVRAWARAVAQSKRLPLYSTAWNNHASLHVAGKLGLVTYGCDYHLT